MGKIGYAPKWGILHSKIADDFIARKGEQGKVSPRFTDVGKAMEWLNAKP